MAQADKVTIAAILAARNLRCEIDIRSILVTGTHGHYDVVLSFNEDGDVIGVHVVQKRTDAR